MEVFGQGAKGRRGFLTSLRGGGEDGKTSLSLGRETTNLRFFLVLALAEKGENQSPIPSRRRGGRNIRLSVL